jgi:hypothetical protein
MFNKLNSIYYYFSQSEYLEKYENARKVILENKYNDDMFITKKEIDSKYRKQPCCQKKNCSDYNVANDIESNIPDISQNNTEHDDDIESVCSHIIIDYPQKNYEEDFYHIDASDMV